MRRAVLWAGLALAACDEVAVAPELGFADRLDAAADLAAEVGALDAATAAEMDAASGTATYEGAATLAVTSPGTTSVVGDLALDVDFDDASLSGSITDLEGRVDGSGVEDLSGSLAVGDGQVGVVTASGFTADVEGTVTGSGGALGVDAALGGTFRADGDGDVVALFGTAGPGSTFTVDGTAYDGAMTVVAED